MAKSHVGLGRRRTLGRAAMQPRRISPRAARAREAAGGCSARGAEPNATPSFAFDLPRDREADAWAASEIARRGLSQFCLMNPAAGWGAKCWPAERFGEVARFLGNVGVATLVNLASGEEQIA